MTTEQDILHESGSNWVSNEGTKARPAYHVWKIGVTHSTADSAYSEPCMGYHGIDDHITHKSGRRKTVCTSEALAFFNVPPSAYHYSGYDYLDNAILRRHGWSVRSRNSALKINPKKGDYPLLSQVLKAIKERGEKGHYSLAIIKGGKAHRIVVDAQGKIVVDTSPSFAKRSRVASAYLVLHGTERTGQDHARKRQAGHRTPTDAGLRHFESPKDAQGRCEPIPK